MHCEEEAEEEAPFSSSASFGTAFVSSFCGSASTTGEGEEKDGGGDGGRVASWRNPSFSFFSFGGSSSLFGGRTAGEEVVVVESTSFPWWGWLACRCGVIRCIAGGGEEDVAVAGRGRVPIPSPFVPSFALPTTSTAAGIRGMGFVVVVGMASHRSTAVSAAAGGAVGPCGVGKAERHAGGGGRGGASTAARFSDVPHTDDDGEAEAEGRRDQASGGKRRGVVVRGCWLPACTGNTTSSLTTVEAWKEDGSGEEEAEESRPPSSLLMAGTPSWGAMPSSSCVGATGWSSREEEEGGGGEWAISTKAFRFVVSSSSSGRSCTAVALHVASPASSWRRRCG